MCLRLNEAVMQMGMGTPAAPVETEISQKSKDIRAKQEMDG